MRSAMLALWLPLVVQGSLFADPPSRLGLPVGRAGGETMPLTPSGALGAPTSAVIGPAPGAPETTPVVVSSEIITINPTDPTSGQPYAGYPLSYPAPPGYMPTATGGRIAPMPAGGAMPGMPMAGRTMPASGTFGSAPGTTDPRGTVYSTGPCTSASCSSSGECGPGRQCSEDPFLENLSIFFGFDGAHEPLDLGINARFGYRFHINWGVPLVEDWDLGLHLGAGYNLGNNAVRVMRTLGPHEDEQVFLTAGVFQRTKVGFNWEFAYDYRMDRYYEDINTTQWRALISYNLGECNEVGLWGALRDRSDTASLAGLAFDIRPMNQLSLFWKHTWDHQIVTGLSFGMVEEHGRLLIFNPTETAVHHPFVLGADLFVPLSDRLALWGEALFVTPNDSGTVIATLGVAWFPAGRPADQPRGTFNPPLPVANNASFPLDVQR